MTYDGCFRIEIRKIQTDLCNVWKLGNSECGIVGKFPRVNSLGFRYVLFRK